MAARDEPFDASIVVPVNARGDLDNVKVLLQDLRRYRGANRLEVLLVVNNYAADAPPEAIEGLRRCGAAVLGIPDAWRPGEMIAFSARVAGARRAACDVLILLDADCRVPDATPLLDWYVAQLRGGARLAYTAVGFHDVPPRRPARVRVRLHHAARWFKRTILGIPTARGSAYAVSRSALLELYDLGLLAEDMNVGPALKEAGARIAYARRPELRVTTSARMLSGRSFWRVARYFAYRLRYNLRVLPVRPGAARRTGRATRPDRRYVNNRPIRRPG